MQNWVCISAICLVLLHSNCIIMKPNNTENAANVEQQTYRCNDCGNVIYKREVFCSKCGKVLDRYDFS